MIKAIPALVDMKTPAGENRVIAKANLVFINVPAARIDALTLFVVSAVVRRSRFGKGKCVDVPTRKSITAVMGSIGKNSGQVAFAERDFRFNVGELACVLPDSYLRTVLRASHVGHHCKDY